MDGQRESGAEEKQHRRARRWSRQWEEDVVGCSLHDRAITRVTGLKMSNLYLQWLTVGSRRYYRHRLHVALYVHVHVCTLFILSVCVWGGDSSLAHAQCVLVSSSTHGFNNEQ